MKYIVVGLGNFGASLAMKLTENGNEVIGLDTDLAKVDRYKESISHTIAMDTTDEFTVTGLPLKETDVVIIAIGEDQGANILTTAVFKSMNVKRLISRAINPLHEKVLKALGVDEIVHPEQETAERWSKKLTLTKVVDSFDVGDNYSIVEIIVPTKLIGKTIKEIEFRSKFKLLVLTIIKNSEVKDNIGRSLTEFKVQGVVNPYVELESEDIIVLYGDNNNISLFLENHK